MGRYGALRGDQRGVRIAQWYMRLVLPYFVALIFSVLVAAIARPWLDNDLVPVGLGMLTFWSSRGRRTGASR